MPTEPLTPERLAELRAYWFAGGHRHECENSPTGCGNEGRWCDMADIQALCDTIDALRDKEQDWVDRSAYYRNIAVEAGAEPECFDNDYDRNLAKRDHVLTCENEAHLLDAVDAQDAVIAAVLAELVWFDENRAWRWDAARRIRDALRAGGLPVRLVSGQEKDTSAASEVGDA